MVRRPILAVFCCLLAMLSSSVMHEVSELYLFSIELHLKLYLNCLVAISKVPSFVDDWS